MSKKITPLGDEFKKAIPEYNGNAELKPGTIIEKLRVAGAMPKASPPIYTLADIEKNLPAGLGLEGLAAEIIGKAFRDNGVLRLASVIRGFLGQRDTEAFRSALTLPLQPRITEGKQPTPDDALSQRIKEKLQKRAEQEEITV